VRWGPAIRAVIIALLLVGTTALAQSSGPDVVTGYMVEQGAASGGAYRLTALAWRVSGTASGGGYRLLEPTSVTLRGSGCCCTYLPCALQNLR
jgi:hypothetical protein